MGIVGAIQDQQRIAWIDEYGELSRQLALMRPVIARHKAIQDLIQSWYEFQPADQPQTAEGRQYTLQISARENQTRLLNIRQVYKLLGVTKFLNLCSITLKAVKDAVGEEVYPKLVETERTGPRTITPVAKAAPAATTAV